MRRTFARLTAREVAGKLQPGWHADGGGLYLQVSAAFTKSWIFAYQLKGRAREMGLGPLHAITLAEAREKARQQRALLVDGVDPIDARNAGRTASELAAARSVTFAQCAAEYIEAHSAGWKNEKHTAQWTATLDAYAAPAFGTLPVQDVDTSLVLKALQPIWVSKPETASRVRARIEKVLSWATVRTFRSGDNPARWRGHLDQLLPKYEKRKRVRHHPALPYMEVGGFVQQLREDPGTAARALEFTILTAARTGEVIGAKPEEFDLDAAVWTVPRERMKAGRAHRVPLSARAVELVRSAMTSDGKFVFQGRWQHEPLSNMAMLQLMRRTRGDLTVHGFRSSFRDWAAECTNFSREVAEMALGHVIGDQTEAAYRRGDLFEKRRRLMNEWARYCDKPAQQAKVLAIAGQKR